MEEDVLTQVRSACRAVAERAAHVHIHFDRIPAYAASLPVAQALTPQPDLEHHYFGHGDDTVAFVVTLDTINFGSGYFPHLRKRPSMSGYTTVASSLTDYFATSGPLTARALAQIEPGACARILGQDLDGGPVSELMALYARAWNDLGAYLLARFEGNFVRLVETAGASAERLVRLLAEMPYFCDVESYAGLRVPFYKRAQIMAEDLWLAFGGQGPGRFDDLERLTIFADNLVPHVLRVDGVLEYEPALLAQIDAGVLIPAGSAEEVEIRACAVHGVELLVGELRRTGQGVTSMGLDYLLWNRGQGPIYKALPRHRTRTVFY